MPTSLLASKCPYYPLGTGNRETEKEGGGGKGAWRDNIFGRRFWWNLKHGEFKFLPRESAWQAVQRISAYLALMRLRAAALHAWKSGPQLRLAAGL